MTVRGGKRWIVGVALGSILVGGGVYLLVLAGLEDADRWASVLGLFLNLAGVTIAIVGLRQARRAPSRDASPSSDARPGSDARPPFDARPASDARPAFDQRPGSDADARPGFDADARPAAEVDNRIGGGEFGDSVTMARDVDSPPGKDGTVSNAIDNGKFHGPVIMGRDVRGPKRD